MSSFEYDIFISYAHIDNKPLIMGHKGWVENFHHALETALSQEMGKRVRVWRDLKLDGTDYFADTIIEELSKTALLVSIVSRGYLNSKWCIKELEEFFRLVDQHGGIRVAGKSRIVKVNKTHISREQYPAELQGLLGFNFYKIDPLSKEPKEYEVETAPVDFQIAVRDLAKKVCRVIELLKQGNNSTLVEPPKEKTLYLAETSADLNSQRDDVRRELEQHGYQVLPDAELPVLKAEPFKAAVSSYLEKAKLSVHLVGSDYGFKPYGEKRSIFQIQHDLALERESHNVFSRIVWIPPELKTEDAEQLQFIDRIKQSLAAGNGSEWLQSDLSDLKLTIRKKLEHKPDPATTTTGETDDGARRVYLICDRKDDPEVDPIIDCLFEQKIQPITPLRDGDTSEISDYHKESLGMCDGILVYYNKPKISWLNSMLMDLRKVPVYRKSKSFPVIQICIGGQETPDKKKFQNLEFDVKKFFGDFSDMQLSKFIEQVKGVSR